ncbi:germ line transcription factor 1 [Choristoneura fumiferana]|uniref:germ line transcription factor 1 n=1 Tax=Choristoneura fumiferana TaxID=7141 RepID=UPI003D159500
MSKDIRLFFRPQKPQKPKLEDDDDVIPESPDVEIKTKKREGRKKRILSDSDEEIFSTKKKKSDESSSKSTKKTVKLKLPVKKELKEVKAVDIFGSAPIKRTEPIVKKVKKNTETGIHSDDDFDQSLLMLDNAEVNVQKNTNEEEFRPNKSDSKETTISVPNTQDTEDKTDSSTKLMESNGFSISHMNSTSEKVESDKFLKKDSKRPIGELNSTEAGPIKHRKTSDSKDIPSNLKIDKDEKCKTIKDKKKVPECVNASVDHDSKETKREKDLDKSLIENVLTDEERFERKRYSAVLYQKYLNRSGPKHLGAKDMPEGAPNCLKDCAFLLTGVLDSFEREEVSEAITKLGGTIKNSMSRKVTHVLAGDEAGPAKIAKAQEFGIPILNESDFLALIVNKSDMQKSNESTKHEKNRNSQKINDKSFSQKPHKDTEKSLNRKSYNDHEESLCQKSDTDRSVTSTQRASKSKSDINHKQCPKEKTNINDNSKTEKFVNIKEKNSESVSKLCASTSKDLNDSSSDSNSKIIANSHQSSMWVEKYKPQTLKQIIGQHGEASNVKKLCNWLTKWYANRKAKLPKPSPWTKNDDGGYYKAALLSGPPGVGKTTTVSLVCKELGFDTVEFNASDTRNKTLIKEQIGELLTTTSLSGFAKGQTGKQAVSKKHVLVMDEVDGMAGNEDRGGLQELIGLIKAASVPIICMCNDRNSQKMRSLVNYCYDLRFTRPRVDQIKAAMMSVCCKEGIKVPGEALAQLIVAANQDVRQTLNLLSMWAVDPARASADALHRDAAQTKKDIKLGPWEAIRKVFSAEEHKTMSIHDKSDLFFYDYSLAPLFVQENYLQVAPHCPKHEVLERLSRAADSISAGDLVDARIRSNQAWNLLPVQAMYSSVIPGSAMSGHLTGQIQFPAWLGKNSRRSKMFRICQEIHAHTRLSTTGSKSSIFLDYCTHLRDAIVTPLVKDKADGIAQSLEVLESYHLLREDLESLTEMSLWPGQRNPMILIDSKVKAAMTRTYNKKAMALPYAPGAVKRARAGAGSDDGELADDGDDDDHPEDSDPESDALIKKNKVKVTEKTSARKDAPGTSKDKPTSSKGKGKKK